MMHGPLDPRGREALDVRYDYLLVLGRSLNYHLSFLSSVLLDVGLSGGANDLDDQVGEADAIELLGEVTMGRVVLSRQLTFHPQASILAYRLVLEEKVDIFQTTDDLIGLVGGQDTTLEMQNSRLFAKLSEHEYGTREGACCQLRRATTHDAQLTL